MGGLNRSDRLNLDEARVFCTRPRAVWRDAAIAGIRSTSLVSIAVAGTDPDQDALCGSPVLSASTGRTSAPDYLGRGHAKSGACAGRAYTVDPMAADD
jgi:hypothetical protein